MADLLPSTGHLPWPTSWGTTRALLTLEEKKLFLDTAANEAGRCSWSTTPKTPPAPSATPKRGSAGPGGPTWHELHGRPESRPQANPAPADSASRALVNHAGVHLNEAAPASNFSWAASTLSIPHPNDGELTWLGGQVTNHLCGPPRTGAPLTPPGPMASRFRHRWRDLLWKWWCWWPPRRRPFR